MSQVREIVTTLGDEVFLSRVVWLEGRIAAGLGRFEEARTLLGQARREFAARQIGYDVDLARRILRFLYRARYDQGLRFDS